MQIIDTLKFILVVSIVLFTTAVLALVFSRTKRRIVKQAQPVARH